MDEGADLSLRDAIGPVDQPPVPIPAARIRSGSGDGPCATHCAKFEHDQPLLASLTIENSNRLTAWMKGMDGLRSAIGSAA